MTPPDQPASRRVVLRTGLLAAALAGIAASCSSDDEEPAAGPERPEESTEEAGGPASEVALLNTALSLEVLILDAYQAGFDSGLVSSAEVADAITLFQQHHGEHRDALVGLVEAAGAEPFTTANPVVKAALVDPTLGIATGEGDFVDLAHDLEQASAQLYVHVTTVATPDVRGTVMSIGASASRRATVLDLLGELGNERLAMYPTANPLPSDAIIPE